MRGHKLVEMIFDRLVASTGAEVHVTQLQGTQKSEIIILSEKLAVVSFTRYRALEPHKNFETTYGSLSVWHFSFGDEFTVEGVIQFLPTAEPHFHIKGGPTDTGGWTAGKGRDLKEAISGRHCQVIVDFTAACVFFDFLKEVVDATADLVATYKDNMLVYCEKTLNPHCTY